MKPIDVPSFLLIVLAKVAILAYNKIKNKLKNILNVSAEYKIFSVFTGILFLVICEAYSCSLSSSIIAPPPITAIKSLKELIVDEKYQVLNTFKNLERNHTIYKIILELFESDGISKVVIGQNIISVINHSPAYIATLIETKKVALPAEEISIIKYFFKFEANNNKILFCKFVQNHNKYMPIFYSLYGFKTKLLYNSLGQLGQAGILRHLYDTDEYFSRLYYEYRKIDEYKNIERVKAFKISDWRIGPIFVILIFALCLCCLWLILEHTWFNCLSPVISKAKKDMQRCIMYNTKNKL